MKNLHIGVAQIERLQGQYEKNCQQHRDFIQQAKNQGVECLVFPELSLNGYSGEHSRGEAMTRDDKRLATLSALAPEMLISVGFPEKNTTGSDDSRCFNSQALLHQGRVVAVHRKLNLPHYGRLNEKDYYTAGDGLQFYQHDNLRIHQLICADLWNPALVHTAMLDLPELLIAPICSAQAAVSDSFKNSLQWQKPLAFYSMIYATPIIMANYIEDDPEGCWGGSCIYDAFGRCLANAGRDTTLMTATVDLSDACNAREQLPTIRDADTSLVRQLLAKH